MRPPPTLCELCILLPQLHGACVAPLLPRAVQWRRCKPKPAPEQPLMRRAHRPLRWRRLLRALAAPSASLPPKETFSAIRLD